MLASGTMGEESISVLSMSDSLPLTLVISGGHVGVSKPGATSSSKYSWDVRILV